MKSFHLHCIKYSKIHIPFPRHTCTCIRVCDDKKYLIIILSYSHFVCIIGININCCFKTCVSPIVGRLFVSSSSISSSLVGDRGVLHSVPSSTLTSSGVVCSSSDKKFMWFCVCSSVYQRDTHPSCLHYIIISVKGYSLCFHFTVLRICFHTIVHTMWQVSCNHWSLCNTDQCQ